MKSYNFFLEESDMLRKFHVSKNTLFSYYLLAKIYSKKAGDRRSKNHFSKNAQKKYINSKGI
jgi:hypothetical protein